MGFAGSALVLGSSFALANKVWVVDQNGGGHFTQIQPAIDAAVDRDTILVLAGVYPGFTIDDKELAVVGEDGANVQVNGQVVIQNLVAGKFVVFGGFSARATNTATLWLKDNLGSVRVQSVVLEGTYPGTAVVTTQAALVESSADVFFTASTLVGASGLYWAPGRPGGHGLRSIGSSVALYDCTLRGGSGGLGAGSQWFGDGGTGGHGCFTSSGFLFASSTSFEGGRGGDSSPYGDCIGGYGWGGDGGHGLAISTAQGELQRSPAHGGPPGQGMGGGPPMYCGWVDGNPGVSIDNPGLVHVTPGPPRRLAAQLVVREASSVPLSFDGLSGDWVSLYLSRETLYEFSPPRKGVFMVPPSSSAQFMGQTNSAGHLSSGLVVPDLGGSVESRVYFLQSVHRAGTADRTLGTGRCLVVLDQAF
jgi:hypothetical protein